MKTINTEHLVARQRLQAAEIRCSVWNTPENNTVNLIEVEVRNIGCNAEINIWLENTAELENLIDTLRNHLANVQIKQRESIAHAQQEIAEAA